MKAIQTHSKMRATKRFEDFNADYHLPTKKTGLPFVVWIWPRGNSGRNVRVGVALGPNAGESELVSVAIQPEVHVVKGRMGGSELTWLRRWVDLNRDVIKKYWDGEIWSHEDAAAAIKPVRVKGVRKKLAESSLEQGEEAIFEFVPLDSYSTNLPFFVWVQPSMGARHGVRVGVSHDWNVRRADMVSVAIAPNVRVVRGKMSNKDLARLQRWVDLNRHMIVHFWNSKEVVYSTDVFEAVKRLPGKDRVQKCVVPDDDNMNFEFTLLGPHLTGLPFYVWVQPSMGARHGVRVGVSYDCRNVGKLDMTSVAIRPSVRVVKGKLGRGELTLLRQWVGLNRDMIVKFWKTDEIQDSLAVYDAVKSLPLSRKVRELVAKSDHFRPEELLRSLKPLPGRGI